MTYQPSSLQEIDGALGSSLDGEALTEIVNDRIMAAVRELQTAMSEFADHVRPLEAQEALRTGLEFGAFLPGLVDDLFHTPEQEFAAIGFMTELASSPDLMVQFLRLLPAPVLGAMLLQFPLTPDGDDTGPLDRHLAVDVAEVLGPDWAQTWYRFAVLVTKLA